MIRTLIVDDEPPARRRLRALLEPFADVEVVGEAGNGDEALDRIGGLRPDLVLLDVRMTGLTGLEVAAALPAPRPRIVFCTAYDRYAVRAFELHAVDYLLKPVGRERLAQALERVRGAGGDGLADALREQGARARRFLARRGARLHVVREEEVVFFGSENGLTKIHTPSADYWLDDSLTQLEERLDPERFQRVSRAAIVRLDAVGEVSPLVGGFGQARTRDGTTIAVSRRRFQALLERLRSG